MEITRVRVKLMEGERLLAFCSVTIDNALVLRGLKILQGSNGMTVAMPSRKLEDRCYSCGSKNHLRARFCNGCGHKLDQNRATRDVDGQLTLRADIALPIGAEVAELIESAVLQAYEKEIKRSRTPYFRCFYSSYDAEKDDDADPDVVIDY